MFFLQLYYFFYGIKSTPLKQLFNQHYNAHLSTLKLETKLHLATQLVSSKYAEQKEFGIQILSKNVKSLTTEHIPTLEKLFDDIYDWGTCDNFSSKVIGEMIKKDPDVVPLIVPWKDSDNLWKQRSSCVSFLKTAKQGKYKETIFDICDTCVKSSERFVQLGNGWILREVGVHYLDDVVEFIKERYTSFSREGLRYAIEKMDTDLRQSLLNYGKTKTTKKRSADETDSIEKPPIKKKK